MSKEIKLDIWPSYNIKHRLYDPQLDIYSAVEDLAAEAASGLTDSFYYLHVRYLEGLVADFYNHDEIQQLNCIHKVCMMGADKYGLGMYLTHKFSFKDRFNSALRHIVKSQKETLDVESGLPHLYHTLANVYMIGEVLMAGDKDKIDESNDIKFLLEEEERTATTVFSALGLEEPKLDLIGGHYED